MDTLETKLSDLDGKGYKALKSIQGSSYEGAFFTLSVDYVQGDPFASPSKLRFFIPTNQTDFMSEMFKGVHRRIAFEHFFGKVFASAIKRLNNPVHGAGKSGLVLIDTPGQAMLDRTAVNINTKGIEFRVMAGLPARGRTILGKQCIELLCSFLPAVLGETIRNYDRIKLKEMIYLADEQKEIRKYLKDNQFIAFIGNGSILPRKSGISQLPLSEQKVVPFTSPAAFEISIPLSTGKNIKGMGIPKGITLIVGGGYHGKSTLLQGLERGVYNHELGDGREYVIVDHTAVKIRAEDRRAVNEVNISPFINQLPFGKRTDKFSSLDASGSTSQAANIMEAMEMETKVLLIDEDTSATNFMIRDGRMQQLVNKEKEPITPFIDRIKQLQEEKDISTVLVIGGSGDYFDVADHVILMDTYQPYDRTEEAKRIASGNPTRQVEGDGPIGSLDLRKIHLGKIKRFFDKKEKIDSKGKGTILLGKSNVQVNYVEQLIDESQTRAIAYMLKSLLSESRNNGEIITLKLAIDKLMNKVDSEGLDVLHHSRDPYPVDLAKPRKHEIAAFFNRIRL